MQAPVYRVVNPLDTVPSVTDRSPGYCHAGVEKKLMGTSFPDTPRQILRAIFSCGVQHGDRVLRCRIYDTVNWWHNIRAYREKLRDNAARAV